MYNRPKDVFAHRKKFIESYKSVRNFSAGGEPLTVLLRKIIFTEEEVESPKSFENRKSITHNPIANIQQYYNLQINGVKKSSENVVIGLGTSAVTLQPNLGYCKSHQWLDMHLRVMFIESGKPPHAYRYPKYLSCRLGWLVVVGQNGFIIVQNSVAVARDPVMIVRRNGQIVILDDGYQNIEFGSGGHVVLRCYGAFIIFEGKGRIKENALVYLCIRPSVSDHEKHPLSPILRVYAGIENSFYVVQIRQRLVIVSAKTWEIILNEHFYLLEFQTLFNLYNSLSTDGLRANGNLYSLPTSVVIPDQSLQEIGEGIVSLQVLQKGKKESQSHEYVIEPRSGNLLLIGNCDHLPSPIVVPATPKSDLTFTRQSQAFAYVMTVDAMTGHHTSNSGHTSHTGHGSGGGGGQDGSSFIQEISTGKYILDDGKCHICFLFTGGIFLLIGSKKYSHGS